MKRSIFIVWTVASGLLALFVSPMAAQSGLGPSLVAVRGRQLIVQKRNFDGTLAAATPYLIHGVNWSPASRATNTSPADPNNAAVRRPEMAAWIATDAPLLRNMNVNTVRLPFDPGLDAAGRGVLDQLYNNGIMVVLTVDDAINDLNRARQAVTFYRNHPAVLLWSLGNEWNINLYYGQASSLADAAQRTQTAAALIKSLDPNHPVASSYGEIEFGAQSLETTQNIVNTACSGVAVWGLNIYRGNTFGTLFEQWAALTTKPMFIGEFGTDACYSLDTNPSPPCLVDGLLQAQWNLSEWGHLYRNLSAQNSANTALGGFAFEFNDEWWKVAPAGTQQTGGFAFAGHPDGFANEEYFGLVDIDRQPRAVYSALATAFANGYQPATGYRALSKGGVAAEFSGQNGVARLFRDGVKLYEATGGAGGGRGFNVATFDAGTGEARAAPRNFDTWGTRDNGNAMRDLIAFLDALPNGVIILLAVADEAGLNEFDSCALRNNTWTNDGLQRLEALGGVAIRSYCYRDSFALAAVKGSPATASQQLSHTAGASAVLSLALPATLTPGQQSFPANGGSGSISVGAPNGTAWTAASNAPFVNITAGASGNGNGAVSYSVAPNPGGLRAGTLTIAGQTFVVTQANAAPPPSFQFSATHYTAAENAGSAVITVTRTGNTASAATVDYATSDNFLFTDCGLANGLANQRCDYTTTSGRLNFAAGETSRTFTIPLTNEFYIDSAKTVNLALSRPSAGFQLGPNATASVNIGDDDIVTPSARVFPARLDGGQENPPNISAAGGVGSLVLDAGETTALANLIFLDLSSPQTAAHIHGPAPVGLNAPVIFNLPNNFVTNFNVAPTPLQVRQLKAGLFYFNVRTQNFPNGEIRGQILPNPLESARFFVRQQYHDFLSRVPDTGGWDYWTGQITDCGADLDCLRTRRVGVSNAFFFELEFQQTGAYVYRLYRAAFGDEQPFPNPETAQLPNYVVFVADRARVVGGASLADAQLALAQEFVTRQDFTARYPSSQTAAQFVDALLGAIQAASGADLASQRATLIALHNSNGRGAVLYRLADDNVNNPIANRPFLDAEYNRSFVATQYYGYLRRDPDLGGFNFWLGVVNRFPLRSVTGQNAMVCAFITSAEYQQRGNGYFTRSNTECPPAP